MYTNAVANHAGQQAKTEINQPKSRGLENVILASFSLSKTNFRIEVKLVRKITLPYFQDEIYRVTIHVSSNLPLISKQNLHLSIDSSSI